MKNINKRHAFNGEYAFLSNMYPAPIEWLDCTFTCSEAMYHAFKCWDARYMFQDINGHESKKLGRKVTIDKDWNYKKYDVMKLVVTEKFKQNPELVDKLVVIDGYIAEYNYWNDTYWGICNGVGQNKLGEILMELRDFYKSVSSDKENVTV